MVFERSSIKEEERTGATVANTGAHTNTLSEIAERTTRYYDGANTSTSMGMAYPKNFFVRASIPPPRKGPKCPKDSTHVPFYRNLPKFNRRRR